MESWSLLSYCPRSSLPAEVLGWLAARLAHLTPPRRPGQGGTRPLSLEVRLDAVAAVLLDGLSYRRAGRMSASPRPRSATAWTCCWARWPTSASANPTGASLPAWPTCANCLGRWPAPARPSWWTGWPPGCSAPGPGPTSRCSCDAKRHTHTAQGLALSTVWGDLLWVDGGW